MRHSIPYRTTRAIFTTAAALSLVAGGAVLCAALFPRHVPTPHDPHVLDLVFDNGPVIWASRLLLVSAAFVLAVGDAFIVASTLVRTRNGDWLRRAGPFEVSEARVAELEDEAYFWQSAARDSYGEIERMHESAEASNMPNNPASIYDDYDKI